MFTLIYAMEITAFVEDFDHSRKLHCRISFVEHFFAEHLLVQHLSIVAL